MERFLIADDRYNTDYKFRVINSAIYALMRLQEQMKGKAEQAGFRSEDEIAEWITNSRREENDQ